MKKKLIVLVLILIGIGVGGYFSQKNKPISYATYDFTKTKTFSSDFMGLSLGYPDSLNSGTLSYQNTADEHISFYKNSVRDVVFDLHFNYGKFDTNNVFEYYFPSTGQTIKELDAISLAKKALALSPPEQKKIEHISQVMIGNNNYYSYAFSYDNKSREDIFILSTGANFIKFEFNNQSPTFIKNILSSVELFDGINSESNYRTIKNESIGLLEASIPKDWVDNNTNDTTVISYSGDKGNIRITLSNRNITGSEFLDKIDMYESNEYSGAQRAFFRSSVGCRGGGFSGSRDDIDNCVSDENNQNITESTKNFKVYARVANKDMFIYFEIDSTTEKNLGNYIGRIIDSITVK